MSSHLEGNRHICTRRTVTIVGIVCIVAGALAVGLIFGNVVDVDGQDGNGNRLQSQSETSTATMTSTTIATTTPTVGLIQKQPMATTMMNDSTIAGICASNGRLRNSRR
eukprot:TRINITY_DN10112_c0_g1_i12.p1 TRINITY_DN10112_c0_g1~~TRINITY_DN10112_c0_g1_i12.p1  ORF type:complete len:109 (+),score=19.59 TRINITY_DN10112_c0_g1_i12:272-598(+)